MFQSTTCYAWRDRVDSSSSRAMLITSSSTPNHDMLLPKNKHINSRRASMPINSEEEVSLSHGPIGVQSVSGSSSTMSNKSSLSSTSTHLKDENVSFISCRHAQFS